MREDGPASLYRHERQTHRVSVECHAESLWLPWHLQVLRKLEGDVVAAWAVTDILDHMLDRGPCLHILLPSVSTSPLFVPCLQMSRKLEGDLDAAWAVSGPKDCTVHTHAPCYYCPLHC